MAEATLRELHLDEATWGAGTQVRRHEWRLAIAEVVQEGRFDASENGAAEALLRVGDRRATLEVSHDDDLLKLELPIDELRPLMEEYINTIREMAKLRVGSNSPRLEALDIAKRITHDEAGETLRLAMRGFRPDHSTARRLFTLLVTLFHDTTTLGHLE
jgi:uncharacterized protein (UPF0262 family)